MRRTCASRRMGATRTFCLPGHGHGATMASPPKALQTCYGRSVSVRAPGQFMSELTLKAERAGVQRQIIHVRRLKMSRYDHTTDTLPGSR